MKNNLPPTPIPSVTEIVYHCALRSGLVRSNEAEPLYDELKAFKDIRKRPGLMPDKFQGVMDKLFERLAAQLGDEMHATVLMEGICRWLQFYEDHTANLDATLVDRETMTNAVLWPSLFASGACFLISVLERLYPIVSANELLEAEAPFGFFLKKILKRQNSSIKVVAAFRAKRKQVDLDNARSTVSDWLSGKSVPSLDSAMLALEAIDQHKEPMARAWLPVTLLLARTPAEHRKIILHRLVHSNDLPPPDELLHTLLRHISWDIGSQLNIGPDRPYTKLLKALYEPDAPRDPALIEEMIGRLESTWRPIDERTRHIIEWFWARHLVLSGRLEEGMVRYQKACEYAAGRDSAIGTILNEAMALAGKLGKKRQVDRYLGLIDRCSVTEWDRSSESLPAYFDQIFPKILRYK